MQHPLTQWIIHTALQLLTYKHWKLWIWKVTSTQMYQINVLEGKHKEAKRKKEKENTQLVYF